MDLSDSVAAASYFVQLGFDLKLTEEWSGSGGGGQRWQLRFGGHVWRNGLGLRSVESLPKLWAGWWAMRPDFVMHQRCAGAIATAHFDGTPEFRERTDYWIARDGGSVAPPLDPNIDLSQWPWNSAVRKGDTYGGVLTFSGWPWSSDKADDGDLKPCAANYDDLLIVLQADGVWLDDMAELASFDPQRPALYFQALRKTIHAVARERLDQVVPAAGTAVGSGGRRRL